MKWRLASDFRGLEISSGRLELAPLTLVAGPNNGGKTQYLKSLVLAEAVGSVISDRLLSRLSFPWWQYHNMEYDLIDLYSREPRLSLAQVLVSMGFRDLAEELAETLRDSNGNLSLEFDRPWPSHKDFAKDWMEMIRDDSRQGPIAPYVRLDTEPVGTRFTTTRIEISYNSDLYEFIPHSLLVENLPGDFKIRINLVDLVKERKKEKRFDPARGIDVHHIEWIHENELLTAKDFWKAITAQVKPILKQPGKNAISRMSPLQFLTRLLEDALRLIPGASYIGAVRIADDRDYSVGYAGSRRLVGRQGEHTWVRLEELSSSGKKLLDSWTNDVLGLRNIRPARESATRPQVLATQGDSEFSLHGFGLGSSQVLPLLVEMAALDPRSFSTDPNWARVRRQRAARHKSNSIIIVEEPESHLHPSAQRALALAILGYVDNGGNIVIETHSEIFVRAIEYYLAKYETLGPEKCSINWVDLRPPRENNPERGVRTYEFSEEGGLVDDLPSSFDQVVPDLIDRRFMES